MLERLTATLALVAAALVVASPAYAQSDLIEEGEDTACNEIVLATGVVQEDIAPLRHELELVLGRGAVQKTIAPLRGEADRVVEAGGPPVQNAIAPLRPVIEIVLASGAAVQKTIAPLRPEDELPDLVLVGCGH